MNHQMSEGRAEIFLEQNRLMISGDLNFVSVPKIWEASLKLLESQEALQFDLSNVNAANSAALTLLIEWKKYATKKNKSLSFTNLPAKLSQIAKSAGVLEILN